MGGLLAPQPAEPAEPAKLGRWMDGRSGAPSWNISLYSAGAELQAVRDRGGFWGTGKTLPWEGPDAAVRKS